MPLYAATIFVSAFLLFLVQPLIGKYLLPWFGGSPGVWTTCLLFFQAALLGGYTYAHLVSTRLTPRRAVAVHLVLLAAAVATLPIIPGDTWRPAPGAAPAAGILLLLAAIIGLPYLALAATGPLLQHWFARAHPGVSPYRLYALSNAGSLLALLGYPFVVEPLLTRSAQAWVWSAGFAGFALLAGLCAWRQRTVPAEPPPAAPAAPLAAADAAAPTPGTRLYWVVLPALATLLLAATTSKLTTDVAVIPFLWVLPLALYLLSFILCFDHPRWYARGIWSGLFAALTAGVAWLLFEGAGSPLWQQLSFYAGGLFAACMLCHGELFRLRPPPRHLTAYYLHIAAGGALGGLFAALVAPAIFPDYWEFQLGYWLLAYLVAVLALLQQARAIAVGGAVGLLAAMPLLPLLEVGHAGSLSDWLEAAGGALAEFHGENWRWEAAVLVVVVITLRGDRRIPAPEWRPRMAALPLTLAALLGALLFIQIRDDQQGVIEARRNFYGTFKVRNHGESDEAGRYRLLLHGVTTHGLQILNPDYRRWPTSYYGPETGLGRALARFPEGRPRHIGVVGLGTGTLAAYGRSGDRVRFYEINPAVEEVARSQFTFLADSPAQVTVLTGDARLVLEAERARGERQNFDVLALDAFSSDAIPVHLLTREAVGLYLDHLQPDGILAVHISNRHLDLRPALEAHIKERGLKHRTISYYPDRDAEWWLYPSTWTLIARHDAVLAVPEIEDQAEWPADDDAPLVLWTDDYASLLGVLK